MKWITQFKQENVFPKKIDNWLSQESEQFYIFFEMYKQCVKFLCRSKDKEDFFLHSICYFYCNFGVD